MAVTIAVVLQRQDVSVMDVSWGADADVLATVPHGIQGGLLGGTAAIPEIVAMGCPPAAGTAAAQRLGDVRMVSADATNVILSKTNAGGSSPIVTRVIVGRKSAQLSASNTALLSALVGGGATAS